MQIKIASRIYTIHRSANPIFRGGERRAGESQWDTSRILVDGDLDKAAAWESLNHEVLETLETLLPPPENAEKRTDWTTTIKGMMEDAFDGITEDDLMALPPEEGLLNRSKNDDEALLMTGRYAHLTRDEFEQAKRIMKRYGIDPWEQNFHVAVVPTREGMEVRLCPHIERIRGMAFATGRYAGLDAPVFHYDDGSDFPTSCERTGYRFMDNGERQPFTVTVSMAECYGPDPEQWEDIVRKKPRHCLEIRAEAHLLRTMLGLPFYLKDEFSAVVRRPTAPTTSYGRNPAVDSEDTAPQSSDGLHNQLIEKYGLDQTERKKLIAKTALTFGERTDGDDVRFYAAVMKTAAKNCKPQPA